MRRIILCCLLLAALPAGLHGQAEQFEPEVYLDRTAFFVGEPIRYEVKIRHDPAIEFILDRLDKATLEMTPFKVIDVTATDTQEGKRSVLTVTMHLVTYEIAQKEWKIPPFNLYYASNRGAAPAQGRPVQRLTVPEVPVGFRSSLPDKSMRIRHEIRFKNFNAPFWTVLSVGLLGLLVIGGKGAAAAYKRMRHPPQEREERSAIEKKAHQAVNRLLEDQREANPAFYREMAAIVREYTGKLSDNSGPSLTAREVREGLVAAGEDPARADRLAGLVALADHIRYADEGPEVARGRFEGVRTELQQLFG
jgi:hypothetical protein